MTIDQIAEICHEANKTLCNQQGDLSQKGWNISPGWQQESAINGVKFHLENPASSPGQAHIEWMRQKEADGWKWGPVKDVQAKEHPCMVSYDMLPAEQQAKDFLFKAIVNGLAGFVEEVGIDG